MREFVKEVGGVQVYYLGDCVDQFGPDDFVVPGRVCAVGVYYRASEYPRFRTALCDLTDITAETAASQYEDLAGWLRGGADVEDAVFYVMAHNRLSHEAFMAWEKVNMSLAFMRSQGCEFMAEAKGEWAIN